MSLTPDQFRKMGLGLASSPAPFLTPRPERRRSDMRSIDWGSNRMDRDREVNVQVLLRCRPLSDEEQRLNVPKGITCNELKREVTVTQNVGNKQVDKIFTFDRVFGPKAQQRSIYDQAISPVVTEVLDGFNCTVFAYGQTGTGKTYTMEGGMRNKGGELPADAGVIPRAVRQIFDTLEAQNADYSMKVTFLELYNEEITDLLAPEDYSRSFEDKPKKPISMMEDGKGCVLVRGLEEEAVYSANEIYNLLERGAAKRRTADTLLNKHSSRSHSVFTITVHIKETTIGSEELIKCGKLNLVDLAGSENISRSGAREARAREAGEINKSLLTLGRVINALVEHSGHVPYRDSKLTRLLRDSLGGKTKTCIIATISPSAHSLEETLSTLDYAHRAKNIRNKPEANQKMSKAVLLKDLYLEIEKMRQDVRAAREKNGVYIPHERFVQGEAEKKEKNEKIEQLEIDLNASKKQLAEYHELYLTEQEKRLSCESDLRDCKISLEDTKKGLEDIQEKHRRAILMLKQKEIFISKLLNSESCLIECAKELRTKLHGASEDMTTLFSKIDQKSLLEAKNQGMLLTFGSQLDQSLKDLHKTILSSVSQQQQHIRSMEEHASSFLASKCDITKVLESRIKNMTDTCTSGVAALNELTETLQKKACSDLEHMKSKILFQVASVEKFFENAVMEAKNVVSDIQTSLNEQTKLLASSSQQQEEGLHRNLVSAQVISTATIDFFNDLSNRTSDLMAVVEKSQVDRCNQIVEFEKIFKEDAAKEELLAMEKIAAIVGSLTAKKTSMVSEASRKIENSCLRDNKMLQQQMSYMQQVTEEAKIEVNEYMENAKLRFMEDTFSSAEIRTVMENSFHDCTEKVEQSMQQWENTQLAINCINKSTIDEAESILKEKIQENQVAREEFFTACSAIDAEFKGKAATVKSSVNDSLKLDREYKTELDSISNTCLDLLKYLRDNHSDSTQKMRNQAEKCLKKDYLVDQHTDKTLRKKVIPVPSLASIEDMKTPAFEDVMENFGSESRHSVDNGGKIYHQQPVLGASPNRSPFADVN